MTEASVLICGLPQSGKSTFLAALWHLVTSQEIDVFLKFCSLRNGDFSHLNQLATRWRDGRQQHRTVLTPNQLVSMNLLSSNNELIRLTFPDLSGEVYSHMWEKRECDHAISEILTSAAGMLLFIHADRIQRPLSVLDVVGLSQKLGLPVESGQHVPWDPKFAPTQVQIVDLLQLLRSRPLDIGPRRLAVMLSAWDKVEDERLEPRVFLATRLPLLYQYLFEEADKWTWRVYGVSAQGGEYEPDPESNAPLTPEQRDQLARLREINCCSNRIKLISETGITHDLTEPIAWLKN